MLNVLKKDKNHLFLPGLRVFQAMPRTKPLKFPVSGTEEATGKSVLHLHIVEPGNTKPFQGIKGETGRKGKSSLQNGLRKKKTQILPAVDLSG